MISSGVFGTVKYDIYDFTVMLDGNRGVTVERRKLENEMFSFEGEKRSLEKRKDDIVTQITHAKKDIIRLESEITELEF